MRFDVNVLKDRFASVAVAMVIGLFAAVAGWRFAVSPMVVPLWSSVLGAQVTIYVLVWLSLCGVTWVLARVATIGFRAALIAAAIFILALAVGFHAFSVVGVLFADAFLIGVRIRRPALDEAVAPQLLATGLAVMALLSGAAELLPINNGAVFTAATLLILLLGLDRGVRLYTKTWLLRHFDSLRPGQAPPRSFLADLALAAMVGVLGLHLLFVLQPERYWDALVMHLYVPSYVLAHGRWSFDVNDFAVAHMPMTVDFLYTWAFALGGENAVRLYNFGSLVLIVALIAGWLRTTTSNVSPMVAALLFASTPLTFIETASLFIENSLTVWITAAAVEATTGWRRMDPVIIRTILVLLAAAVASKLHGVLALALIGLVVMVAFLRTRPRPYQWLAVGISAAACAAFALIPYVYAWVDTGNPVFPLFNQLFRSPYWPPVNFVDTRWTGHFDWALLWKATFHSSRYIEGYDGVLGLSLVVFLPIACVLAIMSPRIVDRLALFIGLGLALLVAYQIQYLRYFYIALPILFFVIGRTVSFACRSLPGRVVTLGAAALCTAAGLFLAPSAGWILGVSDFRADFDPDARRKLVEAQVPERSANAFINERAGKDARVYYTGSPYPGLLEGTGFSPQWYNNRYAVALQGASTPDEVGNLLRQMRINYVVLTNGPATPLLAATTAFVEKNGHLRATLGPLQIYELDAGS